MKYNLFFSIVFLITGVFAHAGTQSAYDKNGFYHAIASDNLDQINAQLAQLKTGSLAEKDAYEGALLMKKSGLIKGPAKEKLSLFKSGRAKLEAAISKDAVNVEYRFLRYIIQENAPKIVKYKSEMEVDANLIRTNFKSLPELLQKFILDYSKKSKALKIP